MNDLVNNISELSPDRRKLLELLLKEQGVDVSHTLILPQSRDRDRFPLSYAQQRLWFLEQLQPGTALYNIPTAVRLSGSLDVLAFQRSLDALVQRHETLRTRFESDAGQPLQVIAVSVEVMMQIIDLSHLSESEQESESLRLAREEALRPFDLETGPLFIVTLVRLSLEEHIALLTMHHIISDGWSMGVLIAELAALYEAYITGKPSPLPELSIQYVDYALWQQRWLDDRRRQEQINYWKTKLDGAASLLALPTDRPRSAVQANRGASYAFELSPELTAAIKDLSRKAGATYFVTLLAIFDVLLYRYSGQDDISIGTPVANRSRAEIEGLIGFFVNTLVLRVDLSGAPSFRELLGRVRGVTLEAQAHQDLPFEMLVDELQPSRDMSYSPFFQVMFALQNAPSRVLNLPDLTLEQIPVHSETSKFDLTLIINEGQTQFRGNLEYDVDLFSETTIARMVVHFLTLAKGIVADPDRKISAFSLLTEMESHQILVDWNQTLATASLDTTIVDRFEAQVERAPDATALVYLEDQLSYSQLNQRANQLAHFLRRHGVGPETMIGLCVERSVEMIVGLLGILKSGGAYVPLDPTYPADRNAFILDDVQAPILLTQKHLLTDLPEVDANIICLDAEWGAVARDAVSNPAHISTSDNLAYAIYTSGSTGRPKGALISHRSVLNLAEGLNQRIYSHLPDQPLRISMNAPLQFDASVQQWIMLTYGHTVYLLPDEARRDGDALKEFIRAQRLDLVDCVPTQLKLLLASGLFDGDGWVPKAMLPGGEAIDLETWQQLRQVPDTQFFNMYGPTECTVDSVLCPINKGPAQPAIGRPNINSLAYILDAQLQPVPVGVPGELFLGGECVGRGYLDRSQLTAERYLPDPFIQESGSRMYRTGDLVRYLSDGNIEYLGRTDFQVKVRGFRIELGEIEAAIQEHEAMQDSVVLAREDRPGDQRLVAYIVSKPGLTTPSHRELRAFLVTKLPDYMLPSVVIPLDALPLMPNGKIDRRALPAPDLNLRQFERDYVAPRTPGEEILVGIWNELLAVERIGVEDNFFELGGHSLLATQVIARIRDAFEVDIPVRTLFEAPRVAGLAKRVEQAMVAGAGIATPPIVAVPRDGDLPLSFGQQRLWFLDQLEPHSPIYNIPDAVRIKGSLQIEALEHSLNEIVHRHEVLRTSIPTVDGVGIQEIAPEINLQLPVIDLSPLPEDERFARAQDLAAEDAHRPFDLSTIPLFRASLLKLGEDDHVFLLTMHHVVSDGWSTGILIRELVAYYRAYLIDESPPLPELPVQYADYAAWQRNWLQGEVLEVQQDYWKRQLGGTSSILDLPTDRPRPEVQSSRGAHHVFTLHANLSEKLRVLSRDEDATMFMTLLAAFQTLLHRYARQENINVGTPIANRNRSEIEGLIGFFVNTLVLRADFSDDPSSRQLLVQVRERALGAYAHQDLPFELLVDELHPQRDMSYTPLFQVMFVLQNLPAKPVDFGDLQLEPLPPSSGLAMFDLTLTMNDVGQELAGALEYNTDLFDAGTIELMMGHFERLLEGMVESPDLPVSALPLMSPAEREQVLYGWNDTKTTLPPFSCLHQLFEVQVERSPDAIAVEFGDEYLSYSDLNRRANQLAHYLQSLGVGPETLVGISVEKSLEMVVGLLGILKAGGAYLPLDPAYPPKRIAFMRKDAGISVLLTQEHLAAELEAEGLQFVLLDKEWDAIACHSGKNPESSVTGDNMAYVIYTSGSTGLPKGVAVAQRSVVNHNLAMAEHFQLSPTDRVLQFATINFDAALEEIFPTWFSGSTLVIPVEDTLDAAAGLTDLIESKQLTVLDLPTAFWHQWVQHLAQTSGDLPSCLRLVVVGGEKASSVHYNTWLGVVGDRVRWLNSYGPTEGTIVATVFDPDDGPDLPDKTEIPIGRPLPNVSAYVTDRHLEPVPVGVPGELCLGGACVAQGYLNRAALMSEKFVPDPFSGIAGARLYRTGDLVRYRVDGQIEFLGRVDDQVKVRGFRIELAEIESVLRQHSALGDVVVVARRDERAASNALHLVAYLVPNQDPIPTVGELRRFLQAQLPDYMVPAIFVRLEALPLTPAGKVDRQALPSPDQDRPNLEADFVPPSTDSETMLVEVWQYVLGLDRIGVNDNFFELGGDSILSIQVIARANNAGLRLTPQQLFQYPTIAGLASVAVVAPPIEAEQGIVTGPVPLTPIQHWFFDQDFADPYHWNQSLFLSVNEPLDVSVLETVVTDLLRQHDALRLRFSKTDTGWKQMNDGIDAPPPFEVVDLIRTPVSDRLAAIAAHTEAAQSNLDLSNGPLLRVVYFDLGPDSSDRLLFVVHHLAMDVISWRVILEDLQAAYVQAINGQTVNLPLKTTSFQVWAERLAGYAKSENIRSEIDYWLEVANTPVPTLPLDLTQEANTEGTVVSAGAGLTAEETKALLQDVPPVYRTEINDVLLAALSQVLSRWTGSHTVLIGLEGHGREDIFDNVDISRTVGWFTTLYPLVLDISRAFNPGDLIGVVKEQLRAVPQRGLGFGLLRYMSNDGATVAQLQTVSQPEISFNYLGQFDQALPKNTSFSIAPEPGGHAHAANARRSHLLDVSGGILGGCLRVEWTYSTARHRPETIEGLAAEYMQELRSLILHCQAPEAGGVTPSDFTMTNLSQRQLDKLITKLKR